MKRPNITVKGERPLESNLIADSDDDCEPKRQRPALDSVTTGVLQERMWSAAEPLFRNLIHVMTDCILEKLERPLRVEGRCRSSPEIAEGPDGRNLRLQFETSLSLPLFTGETIKWEQGNKINVALLDANSGQVVAAGPESCVKLDVVVLDGEFSNEDDDNWTAEEFKSHMVKARKGKTPFLDGDLQMTLKEGVGTLGELTFNDNSSWTRSKMFRLGLKVSSGYREGVRIREAKTEAFAVKERRGMQFKKHYPPTLDDEVWRLKKNRKDGSFHKRLTKAGIHTVDDLLRSFAIEPQSLRDIMRGERAMPNRTWKELIGHAKTCTLTRDRYLYNPVVNESGVSLIFNSRYEFSGFIAGDCYHSADALPDNLKINADTLAKEAYDN